MAGLEGIDFFQGLFVEVRDVLRNINHVIFYGIEVGGLMSNVRTPVLADDLMEETGKNLFVKKIKAMEFSRPSFNLDQPGIGFLS